MKRILLLSTVHPPTDPRIVYKIAPSLAAHYEVAVALPEAKPEQSPFVNYTKALPRYRRLLLRLLLCHPVVLWKCLPLRPAIVHIFVPELIPIAFVFHWLGAQIVYEVQENLYKKFALKRYNNGIFFRYAFRLFDHLARRHFHCIFTDDAYRDEYRTLAHPPEVVHNYPSLAFLDRLPTPQEPLPSPPYFIYTGVISMERAFNTLVAALVLLREQYPVFHVHLFGTVLFDWAEAQALPYFETVRPYLTFYGYTDQRTALSYAHSATAGLALLKPVGDYPDSYTTKLFEYMALGIPVITSDFPLYKDIVEPHRCGFCISPYDERHLADTLLWLATHPEESKAMGTRGRRAVENQYNWAHEEEILLNFYARL
jgi:glycosyltransferase involved in cell wall biosynthesis